MGSLGEDWISFKALRRLFLSGVCCLFETFARLKNMGTFGEDWISQSLAKVVLEGVCCLFETFARLITARPIL